MYLANDCTLRTSFQRSCPASTLCAEGTGEQHGSLEIHPCGRSHEHSQGARGWSKAFSIHSTITENQCVRSSSRCLGYLAKQSKISALIMFIIEPFSERLFWAGFGMAGPCSPCCPCCPGRWPVSVWVSGLALNYQVHRFPNLCHFFHHW